MTPSYSPVVVMIEVDRRIPALKDQVEAVGSPLGFTQSFVKASMIAVTSGRSLYSSNRWDIEEFFMCDASSRRSLFLTSIFKMDTFSSRGSSKNISVMAKARIHITYAKPMMMARSAVQIYGSVCSSCSSEQQPSSSSAVMFRLWTVSHNHIVFDDAGVC